MDWVNIGKEIVKYGAPMLGYAIAGPSGASLGSAVASLFGGDSNNDIDLLAKMSTDPDVSVKLAQLEKDKAVELQQISLAQIEAQYKHEEVIADVEEKDVEEARSMEWQTKDWMPHALTITCICFLAVIMLAIFTVPIPDNNKNIALIIFFCFAYVFFMACRFYLGGIVPDFMGLKNIKKLI